MSWMEVSSSELLFGGGIALMALASLLGLICTIVFCVTGHRLKNKLKEEYGKPER